MKFRGMLSIFTGHGSHGRSAIDSPRQCTRCYVDDTSSFVSDSCVDNNTSSNTDEQLFDIKSPRTLFGQPSIGNWLQQRVPFSPRFRSQSYNQLLERTLLVAPYPLPCDHKQLEM
jgi:hypothetical protein